MRPKRDGQGRLEFQPSNLAVTNDSYAKYSRISQVLDENPEILNLLHRDLEAGLERESRKIRNGRRFRYTSEQVLRILLCQVLEGGSLRAITIRIDDSLFLRRFTRIHEGPMMDFSTLCDLENDIRPETWKRVNDRLTHYAVEKDLVSGKDLRADTTACETNLHGPTDSGLLWDTYRVLARLLGEARGMAPDLLGDRRLHPRQVKRLHTRINRAAGRKRARPDRLEPLYARILGHAERILALSEEVERGLRGLHAGATGSVAVSTEALADEIALYRALGLQVLAQTRRRILDGEVVPNSEKLFSVFEPHTELLIRGKARQEIEFGHMVEIEQVREKFITGYQVFARRPLESTLVLPALDRHRALFGFDPERFAADRGYYKNMEVLAEIEKRVPVLSIAKKGHRTDEQRRREEDPLFRLGQRFRAGVEGTISFLKRTLGLARCYNKTWAHYAATIGVSILAHNLLVLARC